MLDEPGRAATDMRELNPLPPESRRKRHDETRRTDRGTQKRERIIQAGAKVFALRGYAGTTLGEIADVAGTQAASMYYYFPSREDLLVEILTRGVRENLENAKRELDNLPDGQSSADRLRTALRTHVTYMVESDFSRAGIRSVGQLPPDIDVQIMPHWDAYGRFFDELFEEAARDGYLAPGVETRALRMLVLGAANWATHWFNPTGRFSPQELADLVNRMVFEGCGVEDAAEMGSTPNRMRKVVK